MNIETTTVRKETKDMEAFGWRKTGESSVRHGRHHTKECIYARDKEMPNYDLLKAYERKYLALSKEIKPLKEVDAGICIVLFILFIVPMIIYLVCINNKNGKIKEHNAALEKQMKETLSLGWKLQK